MNDLKENNIGTKDTKITRLPLTSDYVFKRIFAREENNSQREMHIIQQQE